MDGLLDGLEIRDSGPPDDPAVARLYAEAFPDEDLISVVRALHRESAGVLALAAAVDGALVGHIVFTVGAVEDPARAPAPAALLAPLAVCAAQRRRGVGGALIRAGLERAARAGAVCALVLGDPAYYGRFGFRSGHAVAPPYPLPESWRDAWRLRPLTPPPPPAGELRLPEPWRRPELWLP